MKKIRDVKDKMQFRLSNRKGAAVYVLHSKQKGKAVYSSVGSGKTYRGSLNMMVYPF
jgi:hypothetical protein